MKFRLTLLSGSLLLLARPTCLFAQEADSQLWTLFTLNGKWKNGLRVYAEVQPRFGENYGRTSRLLLRTALGYQVNPEFSAWLGYGWTPTFTPEFNSEDRLYQQFLWESHYPGFDLTNRTRLEERSISGATGTSLRLRHRLLFEKPLARNKLWSVILHNEVFWNLNSISNGPVSGFDQNRTFFGFGYKLTKHTKIEAGYQVNFVDMPAPKRDQRLDILSLTLNYNL